MVMTPQTVYLVTATGIDAVDRKAYQHALAESQRMETGIQKLGRKVAALKKTQAGTGPAAKSPPLANQYKAARHDLTRLIANRKQLKSSFYI